MLEVRYETRDLELAIGNMKPETTLTFFQIPAQ
jgi:hypothetical protein